MPETSTDTSLRRALREYTDVFMSEKYRKRDSMFQMINDPSNKKPFNRLELNRYDDLNREVMMFEEVVKGETKTRRLIDVVGRLIIGDTMPDLTKDERQEIVELYKELIQTEN